MRTHDASGVAGGRYHGEDGINPDGRGNVRRTRVKDRHRHSGRIRNDGHRLRCAVVGLSQIAEGDGDSDARKRVHRRGVRRQRERTRHRPDVAGGISRRRRQNEGPIGDRRSNTPRAVGSGDGPAELLPGRVKGHGRGRFGGALDERRRARQQASEHGRRGRRDRVEHHRQHSLIARLGRRQRGGGAKRMRPFAQRRLRSETPRPSRRRDDGTQQPASIVNFDGGQRHARATERGQHTFEVRRRRRKGRLGGDLELGPKDNWIHDDAVDQQVIVTALTIAVNQPHNIGFTVLVRVDQLATGAPVPVKEEKALHGRRGKLVAVFVNMLRWGPIDRQRYNHHHGAVRLKRSVRNFELDHRRNRGPRFRSRFKLSQRRSGHVLDGTLGIHHHAVAVRARVPGITITQRDRHGARTRAVAGDTPGRGRHKRRDTGLEVVRLAVAIGIAQGALQRVGDAVIVGIGNEVQRVNGSIRQISRIENHPDFNRGHAAEVRGVNQRDLIAHLGHRHVLLIDHGKLQGSSERIREELRQIPADGARRLYEDLQCPGGGGLR